jgi:hypothetical protein
MVRFVRRLVRLAAATGIVVAVTLSTASVAPAQERQPNCTATHNLHPYSDNMGGAWQLELEARCAEFSQSRVGAIRWIFLFWAETSDGRVIEYFNKNLPLSEDRVLEGQHHHVAVGAPLGHPRYCYKASVIFHGLGTAPHSGGPPTTYLGTHCRNAF